MPTFQRITLKGHRLRKLLSSSNEFPQELLNPRRRNSQSHDIQVYILRSVNVFSTQFPCSESHFSHVVHGSSGMPIVTLIFYHFSFFIKTFRPVVHADFEESFSLEFCSERVITNLKSILISVSLLKRFLPKSNPNT